MSTTLPSIEEITELHHRLAPSQAAFDVVHRHCEIVARLAQDIALGNTTRVSDDPVTSESSASFAPLVRTGDVDEELLRVGALLHDIGTYRVFDESSDGSVPGSIPSFDSKRYILHGLIGYRILLDEGYGEEVAAFARNHTGVGITRQEVVEQHLPLPPAEYLPTTVEQEIVMYADKFNSKSHPPACISVERQERRAARFGEGNLLRWHALVARYGVPDIEAVAREYHMPIK
jgi:uncharacterized protein